MAATEAVEASNVIENDDHGLQFSQPRGFLPRSRSECDVLNIMVVDKLGSSRTASGTTNGLALKAREINTFNRRHLER